MYNKMLDYILILRCYIIDIVDCSYEITRQSANELINHMNIDSRYWRMLTFTTGTIDVKNATRKGAKIKDIQVIGWF